MNFQTLEYFLTVVEEKSFTTASKKLFISQQSLSEYIKRLEDEIGYPLFIRKRPLELTEAGYIFARSAKDILATKASALHEIVEAHKGGENKLVLAISTFEAPPFLPEILMRFKEKYPNITIAVEKRVKNTLVEHMDGIDFYYDFSPLAQRVEHIKLVENDCYCVVLRRSLLKKFYGSVWEEKLNRVRQTGNLLEFSELPFTFLKGYSRRIPRFTTELFRSFEFEPIIGFQSDSGELNSKVCLNGSCAQVGSFFYERCRFSRELNQDEKDPLLLLPLRTPRGEVTLAVGFQRGKQFTKLEREFIATNQKFVAEQIQKFSDSAYAEDKIPASFFFLPEL